MRVYCCSALQPRLPQPLAPVPRSIGFSLLHEAASNNRLEIARLLVAAGARVNMLD